MDFTSLMSPAWVWLFIGVFLMVAELISPGFVIFFFGLGAVTVALFKWLIPGMTCAWQLALFSLLSIAYLVLLRNWLKGVFQGDTDTSYKIESEYVGRIGMVTEATGPDVPGRIVLGDAEWSARSETPIQPGVKVKVVEQKNLTFTVVPV